jgi:hypothetical protein
MGRASRQYEQVAFGTDQQVVQPGAGPVVAGRQEAHLGADVADQPSDEGARMM